MTAGADLTVDNIPIRPILTFKIILTDGCHDEPSALRAPSLPACGWAPPAYGRWCPRFTDCGNLPPKLKTAVEGK